MKNILNNIIFTLLTLNLINCNGQENSSKENKAKDKDVSNMIETTLKSQLLKTYGASNEVIDIKYFEYDKNDLDASVIILDELLKKSGYNPDKVNFEKKVNEIFDGTVKVDNFLYINTFGDKCSTAKNIQYFDLDGFKTNYYFSLDNQLFIGQYAIPELIDYKTKYPEIAKIEETIPTKESKGSGEENMIYITRWKDLNNLDQEQKFNVQLLVNRNLYLFNDDKSRLPWLLKNDEHFMKSLVLTFGWTEDEKLLKWVIENNKFDQNNPQEFGKMFYTKNCDGTLKLQSNTFKYLQKTITPENDKILDEIKEFVENYNKFSKQAENLTEIEKLKILSNIAYFAEQYKYDSRFIKPSAGEGTYNAGENYIFGLLRYILNNDSILEENNYFNLPKFKEWWDKAEYDEYYIGGKIEGVWGSCYKPLSHDEWINSGKDYAAYQNVCE